MIDAKMPDNLPQWMKDHVDRYLKSGGKDGHMYTTNSPTSRAQRAVAAARHQGAQDRQEAPLPAVLWRTGKGYFLVASKGGAPDHPGWYKNILANPEVELQVGTKTMKAKARTASGPERQKLWDNAITWWPPYVDYQKKTQREIPVVVLDPVT